MKNLPQDQKYDFSPHYYRFGNTVVKNLLYLGNNFFFLILDNFYVTQLGKYVRQLQKFIQTSENNFCSISSTRSFFISLFYPVILPIQFSINIDQKQTSFFFLLILIFFREYHSDRLTQFLTIVFHGKMKIVVS